VQTYRAPLADFAFLLRDVFDHDGVVAALPPYADAPLETVTAVLEEAAAFTEGVLLPLNRTGDEEGCTYRDGAVRTPAGFRDAYAALAAGGWSGIGVAPERGGAGLPAVVQAAFEEMACSANLAFATYPLLSAGAAAALVAHGSDEQVGRYVPRLASGEWSGTMCLTEAQAGTDLGLLRTRAEPAADGTYRISGTKVFITGGEHDLTDQIVHLVLARLPDAPSGTAGISLFVVPKLWPAGGAAATRNGVTCGSIEHKMGIRGSATCVLHFEDAVAELVGAPNAGMAQMFTMMNRARLGVGIQGVGIGEVAYQSAVAYARERLQGRAPGRTHRDGDGADPIIAHPDVRRALLRMRALNEAGRALATWLAVELDVARHHPDAARREAAGDLVALLTPVVKAACTDNGFEAANLAIAVHGGAGYITESGVEQLARDARVSQIYEGTNGVQALDLVGRKLPMHHGRLLRRFFHPASQCAAGPHTAELRGLAEPVSEALAHLQETTVWLLAAGRDREQAAAAATDYLRLFALTVFGDLWLRMAVACVESGRVDPGFATTKLATAGFYADRVLPEAAGLARAVRSGKASITAVAEDAF
jgi:alkylation response protein AidB-like acyl-CoA dehydrogenase